MAEKAKYYLWSDGRFAPIAHYVPRASRRERTIMPIDFTAIEALVKLLGFGGVIFVIWIITLRFFDQILKQQKELFHSIIEQQSKRNDENVAVLKQILDQQRELFGQIIREQSARAGENFQVLNKFAEDFDLINGQMGTLIMKIDTNQQCPLIKKDMKPT
jgi:hypothetical protein